LTPKRKVLKTFEFIVDTLPFGYAFNFDNYLFNKIRHINTQGISDRADYFIVNNVKKRIEGKIHFLLEDDAAYSPYKSLFGSFEFSPRLHKNLLREFWLFIEDDLKSRGIKEVSITNFADCYAPQKAQLILQTLSEADFTVYLKAVNHHISIRDETPELRLHPMELRRLNKCRNHGFIFANESAEIAEEIVDFLQQCRTEQKLELSVSKEKLLNYINEFPQDYLIFTVRDRASLLAATIAVKVQRKILYSFLPGSLKKFKSFSPTVLLNEGLYNYCRANRYEILDLGISTKKDGKDQKSLITFKERMGGEKSYKYFFEKKL
jgi:hypothetical protein